MRVEDCRFQEQQNPYVLLKEKGRKEGRRPVGLNHEAAGVIREHLESSGFTSGPLFRARLNSRSKQFAATAVDPATMYRWLQKYLERLPNAIEEYERTDGTPSHRCIYTPHSLRHTTATFLDRAGVDIASIQKLLGHKQVTTTQRYIQRNDGTEDSASHKIPY